MIPDSTLMQQTGSPKPGRAPQKQAIGPTLAWAAIAIFALFALAFLVPSLPLALTGLPQPTLPAWGRGVTIFDRHDHKVCTIYGDNGQQPVHLKDISINMQHAVIAAEDHAFYNHDGINPIGICRAIFIDIKAHHAIQGGSTISQQLIKNLYFEGQRRDLLRKLSEALMSIEMEHRYSKDAIFETYLNTVYFGAGAYGIQSAAQHFFSKQASDLDIAQSAFLAGLITAPSELSLKSMRQQAIKRQQLILGGMQELHFATAGQIADARQEELLFRSQENAAQKYSHYTSEVIKLLNRQFADQDIYTKGYKVYTYLDQTAQLLAERSLAHGIRQAPRGINQGALVSIDNKSGGIIAMVGGAGPYNSNQWNRALSPHTAGSTFKPFVYLAALSQGRLTPDSMIDDAPLVIKQAGAAPYRPHNFDGAYLGQITMRKAIALSRNTCAVRVAQLVGPDAIVKVARQAGITAKLDDNLSIALGSSAVSPLQMASAYETLACDGLYKQARMIRRVEDQGGHLLKQFDQEKKQVFAVEPVAELVDALMDVVQRGTGSRARLLGREVAGKTGTADGGRDVWFIGFTPDMVTAVWGGSDDNNPVSGNATGGSVMASIWQSYMQAYYAVCAVPAGKFMAPAHPLALEPEAIHILPNPADIFRRSGLDEQGSSERGRLDSPAAPGQSESGAHATTRRSLWRRLFGWLNR